MEMLISGFLNENESKNKRVSVLFTEGDRSAEGSVPECKISKNKGFTEDEVKQLEDYLELNEAAIFEEASKVNPIKALMQ